MVQSKRFSKKMQLDEVLRFKNFELKLNHKYENFSFRLDFNIAQLKQ